MARKTSDRWACSVGGILPKVTEEVTEGENAKAGFELSGMPAGTDYNFIIQSEALCVCKAFRRLS